MQFPFSPIISTCSVYVCVCLYVCVHVHLCVYVCVPAFVCVCLSTQNGTCVDLSEHLLKGDCSCLPG